MITLYILRHGEAVDAEAAGGRDEDRTLSERGRALARQAAEGMRKLGVDPEAVWTSPLPRAAETARITAGALARRVEPEPVEALGPGGEAGAVLERIERKFKGETLMVVGHNPDLEELVAALIGERGDANVNLKKGALATVKVNQPAAAGAGKLMALWTAEQLAKFVE